MKKNLPSSIQKFIANPFLSRHIGMFLLLAAILISSLASNAQTTIPVTYTQPTSVGGCIKNLFTFSYSNFNKDTLQIKDSLIGAAYNCATSASGQIYLAVDSSSSNLLASSFNITTKTLTCRFDTSSSPKYIRYIIYIDCSVLKTGDSTNTISLNQSFTHANSAPFTVSDTTIANISSPKLRVSPSNNTFFKISYLDTSYYEFTYHNFSSNDALIQFKYHNANDNMNGYGTTLGYAYKIGGDTAFIPFLAATYIADTIPADSNLIIRQYVTEIGCLRDTIADSAFFSWRCNYPATPEDSFCSACLKEEILLFSVTGFDNPQLSCKRISPIPAAPDYSCFNKTADMVQWQYRFVLDSLTYGAADSIMIVLSQNTTYTYPQFLSLVPLNSIHYTVNCASCTTDTSSVSSAGISLCSSFISDPIKNWVITLHDFGHSDTVTISFSTFRCAEEADTLFNAWKYLNNWVLQGLTWQVCSVDYKNTVADGLGSEYPISQQLEFFPEKNNLSVPHDSIFGDSLHLSVVMKSLTTDPADLLAFLGCSSLPCTNPKGLLRADIILGRGLHILNPNNGVFIHVDSLGTMIDIQPDHYFDTVPNDICNAGTAHFYFRMNSRLLYAMVHGSFECTVQACCAKPNDEPTDVKIAFLLMPNPNNCFSVTFPNDTSLLPTITPSSQAFIPLSRVAHIVNVHCPGCLAPGAIADSYRLRRTSFGLQDSLNLGLADNGLIQITDTSAWYLSRQNLLKPNNSSFGDNLRDYFTIHFQDGDAMMGGYEYSQMQANNSILNYLQISTDIPGADTTFGLTPQSFVFYIDVRDTNNSYCGECDTFQVSNAFKTILKLDVPYGKLNHYMEQHGGQFFYTFGSDTNTYLSDGVVTYINQDTAFAGFLPDQRYRLAVRYSECKPFAAPSPSVTTNYTFDDFMRKTDIEARCWLSGQVQSHNAFSDNLVLPMPNDTDSLHFYHWTFTPGYLPGDLLVNQHFADTFLFFCEFNGTTHYFFSQDIFFNAAYTHDLDNDNIYTCCARMNADVISRTAANAYDPYPYEYRPPALGMKDLKFKVPAGYLADTAYTWNLLFGSGVGGAINTPKIGINLSAVAIDSTITILYSQQPTPACMPYGFINNAAYVKDGYFKKFVSIRLKPNNCNSYIHEYAGSAILCTIDTQSLACMQAGNCSIPDTLEPAVPGLNTLISKADLHSSVLPTPKNAFANQVCWDYTITNGSGLLGGGAANYIYLVVPDSTYFDNWTVTNTSGMFYPVAGQLFHLKDTLQIGYSISGNVCANFKQCIDTLDLDFRIGYDCKSYPTVPFDSTSVCNLFHNYSKVIKVPSSFIAEPHEAAYPACGTFTKTVDFKAYDYGYVYPDSIIMENLPSFMNVTGAIFTKCGENTGIALTGTNNHWYFNAQQLDSMGYTDGAVFYDGINGIPCFSVQFTIETSCTLPNNYPYIITAFAHNFCNDVKIAGDSSSVFAYNDTSYCTTCYTLTKTVDKPTAAIGDTITYTITVCGSNGIIDSLALTDILPPHFTLTYSNLPTMVAILDSCITYIVKGYFTKTGECDSTYNVAYIKDTLENIIAIDSVCNNIFIACYEPGAIVINDGTYSSSLTDSIYSHDTLLIAGNFYIDHYLKLDTCHVITTAGANIIVIGGNQFIVNGTTFIACDTMWRGIQLNDSADIAATNSKIYDAENGIWAKKNNTVNITNCNIENCVTGFRIEEPNADTTIYNYTNGSITGTTIGRTATLKPAFSGQTFYKTYPLTCVFIKNVIFNIGSTSGSSETNYFHDANNGVIAFNSISIIENTKLTHIDRTDTFPDYNFDAAIVPRGSNATALSDITVYPIPTGATTIDSCSRGIVTYRSNIKVNGVKIKNVTVGISVNHCNNLLKAKIFSNKIEAKTKGIAFDSNTGSTICIANDNEVHISNNASSSKGITVTEGTITNEGHYYITNNNVYADKASDGIYLNTVDSAIVTGNSVVIQNTYNVTRKGISLEGCKRATVNCNDVNGSKYKDTLTDGTAKQISISISGSDHCEISCNSVDGTAWGFFFGGNNNLKTTFRGNEINKHLNGLYLNSVAVIDTQKLAGNKWNISATFQAVNKNSSTLLNLQKSLFVTNGSGSYSPSIPTYNAGWFITDTGNTYTCGSTCYIGLRSSGSSNLRQSIARDSTITSDFIPESKMIAKTSLYDEVINDASLTVSDTILANFKTNNENLEIGKLYAIKNILGDLDKSIDRNEIISIDSLIKIYADSISTNDSLILINSTKELLVLRKKLLNLLNNLNGNRNNMLLQNNGDKVVLLQQLAIDNDVIATTDEVNENEKIINNIAIQYEQTGIEVIQQNFMTIFAIANQCPYKGGNAVYRARVWLALINDTIGYDDATNCARVGIFKLINKEYIVSSIKIIPNPASNEIEIVIEKGLKENSTIEIVDALGRICLKKHLKCVASQKLNIDKLQEGYYIVQINSENHIIGHHKLLVIK